MPPKHRKSLLGIILFTLAASAVLSAGKGEIGLRKMKLGDTMPEFSLTDTEGKTFEYRHDRNRVLVVVFLSAGQKQSESAVADVAQVLEDPKIKAERFDLIGVMTQPPEDGLKTAFPILLDPDYKLWGRLGIIAMPTVLIVTKDDELSWIKAGHSYDFAPSLHSHLLFVLGIAGDEEPQDSVEARALNNKTTASRVTRHLQMARMLEEKGRLDSAIAEVGKARALDPDSVEPALVLGELLCRAGKSKEALDAVEKVQAASRRDTARKLVIRGWAKRQMGSLRPAQEDLLEAVKLDPKSARGHFELGRVYLAKGEKDKTLEEYQKALTIIFGDE